MKLTLVAAALALAAFAAFAQGYGYGPGYGPRWGYGPGWAAIQDEVRREHWDARDQMRAEMFKLRQMGPDSAGYAEQVKKVAELREQMFQSRLEARRRIDAALQ